jgi:general secretion pathway protein G
MYNQDHDGVFPWGVDPTDKYTPQIWNAHPDFQAQIATMPLIHELLQPYVRSGAIFRCPADTGYTVEDFTGYPLDATPSSFGKFGSSYLYRTELTFRRTNEDALRTPTDINVLFDGAGAWHGSWVPPVLRYNVVHADGHTKNLPRDEVDRLWATPL